MRLSWGIKMATPSFGGPGGTTFGSVSEILCQVCDNGITFDDPRVMVRTNEATKIILDNMIPVGGYATYDIQAAGTLLLLPPQLENVIEHQIINGSWSGQTNILEGFYNIVNPYAYLEPDEYRGLVLVDQGLVPDPVDPTILRRQYNYPGLQPNAIVRVTGAKRYQPITQNSDYLIVQNVEALKRMIISIERFENNDPEGGQKYQQMSLELLQAEAKKHMLDPMQHSYRLNAFDLVIANTPPESFANTAALLAREVPGVVWHGFDSIGYLLTIAERRLFEKGLYKGTLTKVDAYVQGGYVYFPPSVQTVLAVEMSNAEPLDIRSTFIEYMKNGPAKLSVHRVLIDRGEQYFPSDGTKRRKYKLVADQLNADILSTICKLRWVGKQTVDQMQIKNYEALRLMFIAVKDEHDAAYMRKQLKFQEAQALEQTALQNEKKAVEVLDKELREYLGGVQHQLRVQTYGFSLGDVGCGGTL